MAINKDFLMGYGAGKASGGGGSENPNYTQVITGTVANPFGDVTFNSLAEAICVGNANANITIDATALGFGIKHQPLYGSSDSSIITMGAAIEENSSLCNLIEWHSNGFQYAYLENNGVITDLSQYASAIPTTLTIYWHPMP